MKLCGTLTVLLGLFFTASLHAGLYIIPTSDPRVQNWNAQDVKSNSLLARAIVASANIRGSFSAKQVQRVLTDFNVTYEQVEAAGFLRSSDFDRRRISNDQMSELIEMGLESDELDRLSPTTKFIWTAKMYEVGRDRISMFSWQARANQLVNYFFEDLERSTGTRRDTGWISAYEAFQEEKFFQLPTRLHVMASLLKLPIQKEARTRIQSLFFDVAQEEFQSVKLYSRDAGASELLREQMQEDLLSGADELLDGDAVAGYLSRFAEELKILPLPIDAKFEFLAESLLTSISLTQWTYLHPARIQLVQSLSRVLGDLLLQHPEKWPVLIANLRKKDSYMARAGLYRLVLVMQKHPVAQQSVLKIQLEEFFNDTFQAVWALDDYRQERRHIRVEEELDLLHGYLLRLKDPAKARGLLTATFNEHLDRVYSNHQDEIRYEKFLLGALKIGKELSIDVTPIWQSLLSSKGWRHHILKNFRQELLAMTPRTSALNLWLKSQLDAGSFKIETSRQLEDLNALVSLAGLDHDPTYRSQLHAFYKQVILDTIASGEELRAPVAKAAFAQLRLADGQTFYKSLDEILRYMDDPVRMYYVNGVEELAGLQDEILRYQQAARVHDGVLPSIYRTRSCSTLLGV